MKNQKFTVPLVIAGTLNLLLPTDHGREGETFAAPLHRDHMRHIETGEGEGPALRPTPSAVGSGSYTVRPEPAQLVIRGQEVGPLGSFRGLLSS